MGKIGEQLLQLLIVTLFGLLGSVVIGVMTYGTEVFNPGTIAFSFVSYGLSGAFIFAFYHTRGLAETITAAVVTSAVQFILGSFWIPVTDALIWSFGVNLPIVLLAFLFERKLAPLRAFRFLVVAVTYGFTFVILTLVVERLGGTSLLPPDLFRQNFTDGLLIGLGLGLGVEAGEAIGHSLPHAAGGRWPTHRPSLCQPRP